MNDRYKSCFMRIVFILLMIVVLLIFSMSHSSCHTQKQTNQSATASAMAATVASQDLASASRQKLDRSLSLQLDDLEILFPVPGADGRFAQGEMTDSVEGLAWQEAPSMLGDLRAPARLRARKATITAAAAQEHEDVKTAHLEDSTIRQEAAHNTMEKSVATTAVAKPVPPWALIIILAVAALVIASRIGKR